MSSIETFLAWRYLHRSTYRDAMSAMVIICFSSIALSSFSLILISAIMRGFEVALYEKMQGVHAQATISDNGVPLDEVTLRELLQKEFPAITRASASLFEYVITYPHNQTDTPHVIMIKGIDPVDEAQVSKIEEKIESTPRELTTIIHDNHVIIGKALASLLNLGIGDSFTIFYASPKKSKSNKLSMSRQEVIINGIFQTGIDDFDASVVYASRNFVTQFSGKQNPTHLDLAFSADASVQSEICKLAMRLNPVEVYSWEDRYPALISALILERYAMFVIIILIMLVASMNSISLMYMNISQKRPDIAILRTMGMTEKQIKRVFSLVGLSITATASAAGILVACIVSALLNRYPLISLPDVYFASHLPAHLDWYVPLAAWFVVMIISAGAITISVKRIRSITIATILRFEG